MSEKAEYTEISDKCSIILEQLQVRIFFVHFIHLQQSTKYVSDGVRTSALMFELIYRQQEIEEFFFHFQTQTQTVYCCETFTRIVENIFKSLMIVRQQAYAKHYHLLGI